jgi:hypothetical protein
MENKETTDKITTAELLFLEKYGNKITASESWVIRFAEEYAKLNRDYHLTKQAEVIAEKAKTSMQFNFGASNDAVSKQSILQASEEYKQSVK